MEIGLEDTFSGGNILATEWRSVIEVILVDLEIASMKMILS